MVYVSCCLSLLGVASLAGITLGLRPNGARTCGQALLQASQASTRTRLDPRKDIRVGVLFIFDDRALIGPGTYGNASVALAKHWADRHGYTVFLAEELAPMRRAVEWGKVVSVQKHLPLVDFLIVMDYDVFIVDPKRTVEELSLRTFCYKSPLRPPLQYQELFAWFGVGYEDHSDDKTVRFPRKLPLNAGFIGFRNLPITFDFLNDTWAKGEGTELAWKFPREQGAMEAAAVESDMYLQRICVVPQQIFSLITLESPAHALSHTGVFAWHVTGWERPLQKYGVTKDHRRLQLARAACQAVSETDAVPHLCD